MNVELKELLNENIVTVEFTKKDGTQRVMKCTLSADVIPVENLPKGEITYTSDQAQAVYDVERNGWRSFRWDSLTKYSVGEV
jgi:hypothetical protein